MIALVIAGQLLMAAILDHFGILSESSNPITWEKSAGLALVCIGAIITLKYK